MKAWRKNRNYRKYKNMDGTFTHIITVDGQDVEVCPEVYTAYSQADRRERYCAERDSGRVFHFDGISKGKGDLLSYFLDCHIESAEITAIRNIFAAQLQAAFLMLDKDTRQLLEALVIDGVTEREYAALIGLSQKGVNKRKNRALEKLRNMLVLKLTD